MKDLVLTTKGAELTRRGFLSGCAFGIFGWSLSQAAPLKLLAGTRPLGKGPLFTVGAPERVWAEFQASGYPTPVAGLLFRGSNPPCCGVPVGGIGTGAIDIDARGTYGFSTIFNPWSECPAVDSWRMPRKKQGMEPILGIAVDNRCWVLATSEIVNGGRLEVCSEPFFGRPFNKANSVRLPKLVNVRPAKEVFYWGHYPIVDLEFETDCPVSSGVRVWSPFVPGDQLASNTPAVIFSVHLRNRDTQLHKGKLLFNFPGPDIQEAGGTRYTRLSINEDVSGMLVVSEGGVNYFLGTLDHESMSIGDALGPEDWAGHALPQEVHKIEFREDHVSDQGGSSLGIDFELMPGEEKTTRIVLTWYASRWKGAERDRVRLLESHYAGGAKTFWRASKWSTENYYELMYAERYSSALDVAREVAQKHDGLLRRVISWQSAIYSDSQLPLWLRDSLINNLALLAEDSVWVQPRTPIGDWAYPNGAFGLIESPRGDSDLACIPCDWYGNIPLVYFFPELALSTLRAFKELQREDGAVPFWLGVLGDLPDFLTPTYEWQISLNGTCYVDLVDRLWQRTGNDDILREFYDSAKKCNSMTMQLRNGPGGVISMPEGNKGMEWFEHGEWAGMCAHLGGLHLAQLKMIRRMADHMADYEYVKQCDAWLSDGTRAMEEDLWNGNYYLNFYEKETGKRSDDVMAYQLDGQWASRYHGLGNVFRLNRAATTLETIKRCNVALTPSVGAANFCRPTGDPVPATSKIAAYGPYAMFPAEVLVLAMTYIYSGQREYGIELARKHWASIASSHGHAWDMPNIVRGDTGERVYGTDYYQSLMLWALPTAISGEDIAGGCGNGSLVERVIRAGNLPIRSS